MSRLYSPSWLSPTRRAVIITDRHVGLHNVTTGHMFSVFIFPTSKDEIARPLYSHTTFPRSNSWNESKMSLTISAVVTWKYYDNYDNQFLLVLIDPIAKYY